MPDQLQWALLQPHKTKPWKSKTMSALAPPVPGDLAGEGLDAGTATCYFLQRLLQLSRRRRHRQLLCNRHRASKLEVSEIEALRTERRRGCQAAFSA